MAFDNIRVSITGRAMKFSSSKTPNGKDITKFTVASTPGDKNADGKYATRWFSVTVWGEYGHKLIEQVGEKGWVAINGAKLKAPRTWTDKNTGEVKISEELECDSRDVQSPPRPRVEAEVEVGSTTMVMDFGAPPDAL